MNGQSGVSYTLHYTNGVGGSGGTRAPSVADSGIADFGDPSRSTCVSPDVVNHDAHKSRSQGPPHKRRPHGYKRVKEEFDLFQYEVPPRRSQSMFGRYSSLQRHVKDHNQQQNREAEYRSLLAQKRSLDSRERELQEATQRAMGQVSNTIDLNEALQDRDDFIERLEAKNLELRDVLERREEKLDELEAMIVEQRDQLNQCRQRMAQNRTESDKVKVDNLAHSNHLAYEQLESEYKAVVGELKQTNIEVSSARAKVDNLEKENASLRTEATVLAKSRLANEDPRSKPELLTVIRRILDEKVRWEEYACSMVKRILVRDPALLELSEEGRGQAIERKWEEYSRTLLRLVMDRAPHLLTALEDPPQEFSN